VIGFLNVASPELFATRVAAFFNGLREFGFMEGRNVSLEYRWANGDYARLPALASDLAGRQVNVIAATGGIPSALAAKEATSTIPVVFVTGSDIVVRITAPADALQMNGTLIFAEIGKAGN